MPLALETPKILFNLLVRLEDPIEIPQDMVSVIPLRGTKINHSLPLSLSKFRKLSKFGPQDGTERGLKERESSGRRLLERSGWLDRSDVEARRDYVYHGRRAIINIYEISANLQSAR